MPRFQSPQWLPNQQKLLSLLLLVSGIFALSLAIASPAKKTADRPSRVAPITPLGIFKMTL